MGRLTEDDTARIEEHLLLCEACRNELDRTGSYISAMRSAVKVQPRREMHSWWRPQWLIPAFAGLALMIIGIVAISRFGTDARPPLALTLTVIRGAEAGVSAPAGRSLALTPDLTGLEGAPPYRLEIVDENGARTWDGRYVPGQGPAAVPAQRAGPHFVRIYSPGGELLREYGLNIKR